MFVNVQDCIQNFTNDNVSVYFYVVASLGLGAASVIAVPQVTMASLTVYLVTVIKVVSRLTCATQTQGGVSAG